MSFRAIVARKAEGGAVNATIETVSEDMLGDVSVAVEWSSVNYKDAIAILTDQIIQSFPLIPGIDFAGTVTQSDDPRYAVGDKVVATGYTLGVTHNGGFAQQARVKADWLVKLPGAISTRNAMAIGTAGFTAMLSVLALEHGGITPARGPVLVTGASGGVGSIATAILAKLGYRVIASTGKAEAEYLTRLGASEILNRADLSGQGRPIAPDRWPAAIDTVGGQTLVNVIAQTGYRGVVTACGFVGGRDLPASVLPFILRNITLAGIDSINAPATLRQIAWQRLANDLDPDTLASTISEVGLADVPAIAGAMVQGRLKGRTLVNVNA
ncbi:MAG: MDR family oxidoreductase [Sphingomonas oligoaromativorans]